MSTSDTAMTDEYRWGRVDQALVSIAETLKLQREDAIAHAASDNTFQGQIAEFIRISIAQDATSITRVGDLQVQIEKGFTESIADRKEIHKELTAIKTRMYWMIGIGVAVATIVGPILVALIRKLVIGV